MRAFDRASGILFQHNFLHPEGENSARHTARCAFSSFCRGARTATTDAVEDLRREARALKECVADLTLENHLLKKA